MTCLNAKCEWDVFLRRFEDRLEEIAKDAAVSCEYGTDDVDKGAWCEKCAPKKAYRIGWEEHDYQHFCEKCGKVLDHPFTDWGLRSELGNLADNNGPVSPDEAFTLLRCIVSGGPLLRHELRPEVRRIAKRLGMHLP